MIAALDPFHDERISDLEGWPDLKCDPSVVRMVKKSITISPLEAGGNIVIYTLPLVNDVAMSLAYRAGPGNNFIDKTYPLYTGHYGGTYVQRYKASEANAMLNVHDDSQTLAPDDDYLKGECRIIGWGIEVHDVTPELYKAGTVTVCEIPQPALELSSWLLGGNVDGVVGNLNTGFNASWLHGHPTALNEAVLTPGSRQWEAKFGCYTVVPFQGRDNLATYPQYVQPILGYKADSDLIGGSNHDEIGLGQWAYLNKGVPAVSFSNRFAPFNSKCIILSGLQSQASFTINVNYFIETFPGVRSELITLAQPSACFDPVALRMISEATRKLPVAVPVAENGLGDWFAEVVSDIAPYAAALLTAGGLPEFAPVALAAKAMADNYRKGAKSPQSAAKAIAPPNSFAKPAVGKPDPWNTKPKKRRKKKMTTARNQAIEDAWNQAKK